MIIKSFSRINGGGGVTNLISPLNNLKGGVIYVS